MTRFPEAKDMATSLQSVVRLMVDAKIVEPGAVNVVEGAVNFLRGQKASQSWVYSISQDNPIRFVDCIDRDGRRYNPEISVESIRVDSAAKAVPFAAWNVALTLKYQDRDQTSPRWHFDLGNTFQGGPRMHLQYGGRENAVRALDERIKEPRWNMLLMDTVLLAEAVAANFYPVTWREKLNENRTFKGHVKRSEQLCYPFLLSHMQNVVNTSDSGTVLASCWNDYWE